MVRPPGLEPGSEMPALRSGAEVPWVSHVVNYDEVGPGRKSAILDYREPLSLAHRHRGRVALRFTVNERHGGAATGQRRSLFLHLSMHNRFRTLAASAREYLPDPQPERTLRADPAIAESALELRAVPAVLPLSMTDPPSSGRSS